MPKMGIQKKKRKKGVVYRRRRVQIFWVLKHYGLLHLFLFVAPSNLVDMEEFLSFELVAFLLLLCEAVNFLQKSNKPNHSEKISKIVEEKSCSYHRQTNDEPKTAKNQNYQYVVDWNSLCLPSSGEMIKHIAKLWNILLALFLEGMEKALESLIGMTENLQLKIWSIWDTQ